MPDKEPQFVVNDRRKFNFEGDLREGDAQQKPPTPEKSPQPSSVAGPQKQDSGLEMPAGPSAKESAEQQSAYQSSAGRIDDMVRAQNPGAPREPEVSFLHVVQSLYMTALMQLGVGAPQGEQMRVDILGARQTIDMLNVVSKKTAGNLTADEQQMLDSALFELRMVFTRLATAVSNEATVNAVATAKKVSGGGPKNVR